MNQLRIGSVAIELYLGDITDLRVDAVVNAANNYLQMGAGVAGAIKRRGGHVIEQEAVAKGPIPIGEAVATTAGNLKARYVIHAAGMGPDLMPSAGSIRESTKNSLRRAEELHLRSIAFPAIGTGVGRFPLREAAKIMIRAVGEHVSAPTSLRRIVFALYTDRAYGAFEEELLKKERRYN